MIGSAFFHVRLTLYLLTLNLPHCYCNPLSHEPSTLCNILVIVSIDIEGVYIICLLVSRRRNNKESNEHLSSTHESLSAFKPKS